MFCPVCRDEYRPGFTRCATCDVELVPALGQAARPVAQASVPRPSRTPAAPVSMIEYCGFESLEDARGARDVLRQAGIRNEIVIRDGPDSHEEFWLHVDRDRFAQAAALLGFDEATHESHETDDSTFQCGECGAEVASEESFCPKCGARFEES